MSSPAAGDVAAVGRDAYLAYRAGFRALTRGARRPYEAAGGAGAPRGAGVRLYLYASCRNRALERLRGSLGERFQDRELWRAANRAYARALVQQGDAEMAETFFNSVCRRVFAHVGVDPRLEFVHPA